MSERNVDALGALFHDNVVFVHMGATMSKAQELQVIRTGGIQYKHVEIQDASVRFIGETAILLNRIRLVAVAGGNEVTNPFVVTEVYVRLDGRLETRLVVVHEAADTVAPATNGTSQHFIAPESAEVAGGLAQAVVSTQESDIAIVRRGEDAFEGGEVDGVGGAQPVFLRQTSRVASEVRIDADRDPG